MGGSRLPRRPAAASNPLTALTASCTACLPCPAWTAHPASRQTQCKSYSKRKPSVQQNKREMGAERQTNQKAAIHRCTSTKKPGQGTCQHQRHSPGTCPEKTYGSPDKRLHARPPAQLQATGKLSPDQKYTPQRNNLLLLEAPIHTEFPRWRSTLPAARKYARGWPSLSLTRGPQHLVGAWRGQTVICRAS